MRGKAVILIGILIIAALAGYFWKAEARKQALRGPGIEPPALSAEDLKIFAAIANAVLHAPSMVVYEGLPHQMFDADMLKQELATKQTVQIQKFPFYTPSVPISRIEANELCSIVARSENFTSWSGLKLCGGFHPDYCLQCVHDGITYDILICFGCHEMKLHTPNTELTVDINDAAYEALWKKLKPFRKQRPKSREEELSEEQAPVNWEDVQKYLKTPGAPEAEPSPDKATK